MEEEVSREGVVSLFIDGVKFVKKLRNIKVGLQPLVMSGYIW